MGELLSWATAGRVRVMTRCDAMQSAVMVELPGPAAWRFLALLLMGDVWTKKQGINQLPNYGNYLVDTLS